LKNRRTLLAFAGQRAGMMQIFINCRYCGIPFGTGMPPKAVEAFRDSGTEQFCPHCFRRNHIDVNVEAYVAEWLRDEAGRWHVVRQ
jgi:hypothetical protein